MEELKKLLSEKYLGMGEYFKQTFSLMTKIGQKEIAILGGIALTQIVTSFFNGNPVVFLITIISEILLVFLLQRIISYIEGDDDGYANLKGISNNASLVSQDSQIIKISKDSKCLMISSRFDNKP